MSNKRILENKKQNRKFNHQFHAFSQPNKAPKIRLNFIAYKAYFNYFIILNINRYF